MLETLSTKLIESTDLVRKFYDSHTHPNKRTHAQNWFDFFFLRHISLAIHELNSKSPLNIDFMVFSLNLSARSKKREEKKFV